MTLAEQLRSKLDAEFETVREQLDAHVCRYIVKYGSCDVGRTHSTDKLIDTEKSGMNAGRILLNERLFDAARAHYTQQGLKFRIDYSPMGTFIRGFSVSLL